MYCMPSYAHKEQLTIVVTLISEKALLSQENVGWNKNCHIQLGFAYFV